MGTKLIILLIIIVDQKKVQGKSDQSEQKVC